MYNDVNGYDYGLQLRDQGTGYKAGDLLIVLNQNGTANNEGERVKVTVGNVYATNSVTHDLITIPTSDNEVVPNMVRMIAGGNADERELYAIRCRNVTNR